MKTKLFLIAFLVTSVMGFSQTTYIEDANFENYLETHNADGDVVSLGSSDSMGNGVANDQEVLTENIVNVKELDVSGLNILTLNGIGDFTALTHLFFYNNDVREVNLANNINLSVILCSYNKLSSLFLDTLKSLQQLNCSNNNLTELFVRASPNLSTLEIYNNDLPEVDLLKNTGLRILKANNNKIEVLDLSKNSKLGVLQCENNSLSILNVANGNNSNLIGFWAKDNPNLSCIQLDNLADVRSGWDKDATASYGVNCYTNVPDDNFEQALIDLNLDDKLDNYVTTANISGVTYLDINSKNISSLEGVEDFVALETLWFYTNTVTEVDLTKNVNLKSLSTGGNNLTSLDLTQNVNLIQLSIVNNNISTIDLSKNLELLTFGVTNNGLTNIDLTNNTKLRTIQIGNNNLVNLNLSKNTALTNLTCDLMPNLVNLDLRNGNNANVTSLNFFDNPNLSCILVDNAAYSSSTWAPATASNSRFIESKSECSESYTYMPDNNFEQILIDNSLDDFLDDYITTSDISLVGSIDIPSFNISDLTGIEDFEALVFLGINDNNLTEIDLSKNLNLESLSIQDNNLTILDLSKNLKLTRVNCDNNTIEILDLSKNTALVDVSSNSNNLTSLNVKNGNNANLIYFHASNNPNLTCIEVDDINLNWASASKDATASYSTDCSATASIVDTVFSNSISVYPNPVNDILHINLANDLNLESVEVFNLLGKKIIHQKNNEIDFTKFASGMYVLKIKNKEGKIATRKVVKH